MLPIRHPTQLTDDVLRYDFCFCIDDDDDDVHMTISFHIM